MRIVSSAPTRIGLVGGGTDVDPFATQFGGKVLNLAINLRHTAVLEPTHSSSMRIAVGDDARTIPLGGKVEYGSDPKFDLVYAVLNHFSPKLRQGFSFSSYFDGRESAGLGSSGSAAVSMIGALSVWLNISMTKMDIALLAWELETKELGWTGGKQDQLAAAYGGINLMTFGPGNQTSVQPLTLGQRTVREFSDWTLLCLMKGRRHSAVLQKKLVKGMTQKERQEALIALRDSVDLAARAIRKPDWYRLGKLLDQAWEDKKKSNPAITSPRVDRIYSLARASGALGGKLMGAGGVGHLFFLVPPDSRETLRTRLIAEGLEVIPFSLDFQGLLVRKFSGNLHKAHRVDVRRGFSSGNQSRAVFLDRDGVISLEKHLVHRLRDFELLPGAAEAIKRLNNNSIPVIVYHNASVVARGLCGEAQVVKLHGKMKQLLAKKGAYVDAILFCPHHPQAFDPRYELDCPWRKPKPGMLKEAQRRFGVSLRRSFVVGDSGRDILMGKKVGAQTILVRTGHAGRDSRYPTKPQRSVKDLPEAVDRILQETRGIREAQ